MFSDHLNNDESKRNTHLVDVYVFLAQTGHLKNLWNSDSRRNTHIFGLNADDSTGDVFPNNIHTLFFSVCTGSQNTDSSTISYSGRVSRSCRGVTPVGEDGFETSKTFSGYTRTDGVVHGNGGSADSDGYNFVSKYTFGGCLECRMFDYLQL